MAIRNSRRTFIQQSTLTLTAAFLGLSFNRKNHPPLLSFSTLGCPGWSVDEIINFAAANDYQGIELRGILKQMDLAKVPEFSTAENIRQSLGKLSDKKLKFVDLGSSTALHHDEGAERTKNLDEAKRFIDLAQQLHCPYIRVFPNELPKNKAHDEVIELITKGLITLGDYAKGSDVTVLMETHGDVVKIADIKKIITTANHPKTGLVWDPVNMWGITKESPTLAYNELHPYIKHVHIKDAIVTDNKPVYTLLGKGNTPVFEAIDILRKNNYKGYYSFEWEKLWHPEIAEPEIALADYPKAMASHFAK
ncbi:sugar phosphate isomerase/epimerase [Chitinophagaceae bacterium 26-R-25]|nr:sugar phosphate isomerase/epimerase [Chitinophagaceae bacterium 26-R-25]